MTNESVLREHIRELLDGGHAHIRFDEAVKDFPAEARGVRPGGSPHSAWELLEHLRIAQWDILEFVRNPKHVSPKWPEGYWPESSAPPNAKAWDASVTAMREDLDAFLALAGDESLDLGARIKHGDGQTILRELFLVADHNAYHLGQLMLVRRMLAP